MKQPDPPRADRTAHFKMMYDQAARLARLGAWECRLEDEALTWTDGVYDLFEIPSGTVIDRASVLDFYHDDSRRQLDRLRAQAIRTGASFMLDARIRTQHGSDRWMRLTAEVACRDGQPFRIFGAKQDITHEKRLWDSLRQHAEHDSLTGLANRRVFEARCESFARRTGDDGSIAALALIDLDDFKEINDQLGHGAGDECLRQFAARLHRAFDKAAVIARMGGDEFAVLFHAPRGPVDLANILHRVPRVLCRPVLWRGRAVPIGASVGVTIMKQATFRGSSQLFAEADSALYVAKSAGRNRVRIFGGGVKDRRMSSKLRDGAVQVRRSPCVAPLDGEPGADMSSVHAFDGICQRS